MPRPHLRSRIASLLAILALALLSISALRASAAAPADLARQVAQLDRARILKLAGEALKLTPPTIAAQRATLSEGGPNDYYSNGDYWHPDPSKKDGLPYIQRDGETNPNMFVAHRQALRAMKDAVAALGAAYALTGDDLYAAKAAELVRVFFLDAKTKMNPHLKYAQAIPGRSPGRGIGIIDTLHLAELPFAARFLERSPAFVPVAPGLKAWFADYLHWMLTHPNGIEEMNTKNNHAVAFFVQVAAFALYVGDQQALELARKRFTEVLMPNQMAADGSFPAELKRTKPYGYSIFQLDNVATLARLLSTPQSDLWRFELTGGRTVKKSVEYLYPYLADKNAWPHPKDIQHWESWPARQPALLFAYAALGDAKYFELWKKLPADPADEEVRRNMAITQPLLWIADPQSAPFK